MVKPFGGGGASSSKEMSSIVSLVGDRPAVGDGSVDEGFVLDHVG